MFLIRCILMESILLYSFSSYALFREELQHTVAALGGSVPLSALGVFFPDAFFAKYACVCICMCECMNVYTYVVR